MRSTAKSSKRTSARPKPSKSSAQLALQDALYGDDSSAKELADRTTPDVYVRGIHYYVDWPNLRSGSSFFLKTTATAREVLAALKEPAGPVYPFLKARERHEFGYYGVRVWRLG